MTQAPRRRRARLLRCIPPASVLRQKLNETLDEARQLQELLVTAERIEATESHQDASHDKHTEASRG
jgi:hypothetical protein